MSDFQGILSQIQRTASDYDIPSEVPRPTSRQEIEQGYDNLLTNVTEGYSFMTAPHTPYVIKPVLDRVRTIESLNTRRFIEEGIHSLSKLREIAREVLTSIDSDNPDLTPQERLKLAHTVTSLWLNSMIKFFWTYDIAIDANLGNIGTTRDTHSEIVRRFVNTHQSSGYSNDTTSSLVGSGLFVPGKSFDLDHLSREIGNITIGRSPYKLIELLKKETQPGLFRDKLQLCLDLVSRNLGDGYRFFTDSVDFLTLWDFYAHQGGVCIRDITERMGLRKKTTSYLRSILKECYLGKLRYKPPFVFGALVALEDSGVVSS